MRNLIKLNKDISIVYNSTISEYINADYIYVPIIKNYKILVKDNEIVNKGQVILENNLNKVLSPISGKVVGYKKMNIDGLISNALIIQNDFKELEKKVTKRENKLNKETIINKLYEFHFNYIASLLESKKINNLVINAIDDEPYILNREYIINKYLKEILEMTDIFANTFDISRNLITIKSNNAKNVENILSRIGTYPNINISLIEDKYLLGKDVFLLEQLGLKDSESLVIDVKLLLEIYRAIKLNKNTFETFITITGQNISKSKVLKVKVGTLLKDIIENNIKLINSDNNEFILNGLMTGSPCDINNTIVSKNTLGVVIVPKGKDKEGICNNCGLCYRICPVKINPKRVIDTKKVNSKCIDCGLCSYICPCNINIRKYLRGEYDK